MSELEFWKDLGNIFDAVMDYQKKNVEFNSRFINPWIRLGNVFDRQDQANDAVQAYQRATEIDPDSPQNWIELGDAQFKNGDYDQAVEAYRKAVTLDPEAGWPLGNLALSLVTQGKIEDAIPLYKKSIDLLTEVKDKAICWNRLGNAYRKLNDYENAFHAFQKADQLDGDNTGFSDKLDETQTNTSVIAPEDILEQMQVDQIAQEVTQEVTAESSALEVINAPAEEVVQPEAEVEPAPMDTTVIETADGNIGLAPNTEMIVEETASEEEIALPLDETSVEEPSNENAMVEEETPMTMHEKKFDLLQVVEAVIAKVEQAYADKKSADADEEKVVEEVSAESELPVVNEESVQEVETIPQVNEDVVPEVVALAETTEEVTLEVISLTETNEEVTLEVETVSAEVNQEVAVEMSAAPAEEINEPRRAPSWLLIRSEVKTEEKISVMATEVQPEPVQVESVTTLSEISQETIVSDSVVNMEIVETYTDPLAAQLTTEPNLSDGPILSEAIDQAEGQAEPEAQVMAVVEPAIVEEKTSEESVIVKESSTVMVIEEKTTEITIEETVVAEEASIVDVAEEKVTEIAYEEYLKDMVEPTHHLKDHVDDIQGDAPITKISKNGEVRIAMDTKNAHVWNELGNIYLNAGTYDDAIASYSKAIELDRQFAWPYSNLALAYVQKGRFAEAILLYQRGIELFNSDKDKAITWNRLGNVYRRINDYGNAIASYQTADELDPENATLSLRTSFGLLGNMYSDSKPALAA